MGIFHSAAWKRRCVLDRDSVAFVALLPPHSANRHDAGCRGARVNYLVNAVTKMKFRKLRIAWSVFWGVAIVLLIVLWVRSYWRQEVLIWRIAGNVSMSGSSFRGTLGIAGTDLQPATYPGVAPPRFLFVSRSDGFYPMDKAWSFGANYHAAFATVPIWFAILFISGLAAAPWMRWSRRFGLRTLLIAMTLVAMVLGLIEWSLRS
jgi:hypothetical protein